MLLAIIVFVSVFLITALLIAATGVGASERMRQTLKRLDGVLSPGGPANNDEVDVRKQEILSAIPLLNHLLQRVEIAPKLRRVLYQANLKWTPGGLMMVCFAIWGVAAEFAYLRTGTIFFSLVFGLVIAGVPFGYVLFKRASRFLKFEEELPAALDLMVSGLRGGQSLVSVLGLVSREAPEPIGPEFRICFDEQNYGLDLRTALENLALRMPIQDIRIVITAILIQKETGGNLAEVLEKVSHVIRERFRLKREIRTKTAQGRLSGWVLSLLPVGLGIMLYLIRPEIVRLLWTRPAGLKMLYVGSVMIVIGSLLIRKIVRIRV
jgi:tight adherence protein B